jgi:hypothetical protein
LGQRLTLHTIEIGQRQQCELPGRVLGQAPLTDFGEVPRLLDEVEGMFDEDVERGPLQVTRFLGLVCPVVSYRAMVA